ncbi:MAG: undecaprenyldiphospho-muramoylpentapeptide beta-N-acetylglucosaminyltransferase [Ignavibacteria bacterium]|nr:undecaprenyldiphospho-muramoylpentapeptide beta-N-acetylglucosaminyltransferase [Ignavibacteria bacterium]
MKILVSAGGTGGHFFPATSVINEIQNLLPNETIEVFSIGNPNKIEGKLSKKLNWNFTPIPLSGFPGIGFGTLKFAIDLLKSKAVCKQIIRKNNIAFGIATGAYVSLPAGLSLNNEKKPFFLFESNLIPGKANKFLSRKADLIFTTFDDTITYLPKDVLGKIRPYGTPIRKELFANVSRLDACGKFGLSPEKPILLIFGGSLGALSINLAVSEICETLLSKGIQMIWQIGENFKTELSNIEGLFLTNFIEDMGSAYTCADLVISRAGASTIAEISALGKPAILVPYPFSTNDHQLANAKILEQYDSAIMIQDNELREKLPKAILEIIFNQKKLTTLQENIKKFGKRDSAEKIAKEILKYLNYLN